MKQDRMQEDLGFVLALIIMLLISPLGWIYYFPFLLLPVWLIIKQEHSKGSRMSTWIASGLWIALAILPMLANSSNRVVFFLIQSGFYSYALLGFAALLVGMLIRRVKEE